MIDIDSFYEDPKVISYIENKLKESKKIHIIYNNQNKEKAESREEDFLFI